MTLPHDTQFIEPALRRACTNIPNQKEQIYETPR